VIRCVDEIDALGKQKDDVMADAMQVLETIDVTEELMKVHQKLADKMTVFESFKQKFVEHFDKIS
jgi:hypothetical protein